MTINLHRIEMKFLKLVFTKNFKKTIFEKHTEEIAVFLFVWNDVDENWAVIKNSIAFYNFICTEDR